MLYFLHSQEYLMLYEKSALGKHLQAWRTASLLGFLLTPVLISTPTQLFVADKQLNVEISMLLRLRIMKTYKIYINVKILFLAG